VRRPQPPEANWDLEAELLELGRLLQIFSKKKGILIQIFASNHHLKYCKLCWCCAPKICMSHGSFILLAFSRKTKHVFLTALLFFSVLVWQKNPDTIGLLIHQSSVFELLLVLTTCNNEREILFLCLERNNSNLITGKSFSKFLLPSKRKYF